MTVIFDLRMEMFPAWCFPVGGLVFAAAGLLFLIVPDELVSRSARELGRKPSCILFMIIGILGAATGFTLVTLPYLKATSALTSGNYKRIEGALTSYQPGRIHPAHDESFIVSGLHFKATPYALAAFGGFAHGQSPNLKNPEGVYVRIGYLDGTPPVILRVEASP